MKSESIDPKDDQDRREIRGSSPSNPQEDQDAKKDKDEQTAKDAAGTMDDD